MPAQQGSSSAGGDRFLSRSVAKDKLSGSWNIRNLEPLELSPVPDSVSRASPRRKLDPLSAVVGLTRMAFFLPVNTEQRTTAADFFQ
jgi:hypothetical protein